MEPAAHVPGYMPSHSRLGVLVNRLDYELLYGLSCDVSLRPCARLAEVFRGIRSPFPGRLPTTLACNRAVFQ